MPKLACIKKIIKIPIIIIELPLKIYWKLVCICNEFEAKLPFINCNT